MLSFSLIKYLHNAIRDGYTCICTAIRDYVQAKNNAAEEVKLVDTLISDYQPLEQYENKCQDSQSVFFGYSIVSCLVQLRMNNKKTEIVLEVL